jgi:hypothetical protein
MPEYGFKINYFYVFKSDKTLEELSKMNPEELFKIANQEMLKSGDFWGDGIRIWERVFKDCKEYSKNPPKGSQYCGIGET